jgi:predicted MFS family arabinose efflux permease
MTTQPITRSLIVLMAVACGLSAANLYYSQPLLADIARQFNSSIREIGFIPMFTQIGYALGMLLFVPLGDMVERRRLILLMLGAVACALCLAALSPNLVWLIASSLLIGVTTIVPQLLVPFAAQMARPSERGRVVGSVMSGLLIGILLARTVSGFIGAQLGWRAMYWMAAALMVLLTILLAMLLPRSEPTFTGSYKELMRSLIELIKEEPSLREAAIIGAMLFAAFSAFWTTLVFLLEQPPFYYGSQAAGLFGLVGAAGALGASLAGQIVDRRSPKRILGLAILITIASFIIFWLLGQSLFGLIVGVVLMDLGVQGGNVSNQTRIYSLSSNAHNRLNTVYMVTYFVGGAAGSSLGAWSWSVARWGGVCLTGLIFLVLALLIYLKARVAERGSSNDGARELDSVA